MYYNNFKAVVNRTESEVCQCDYSGLTETCYPVTITYRLSGKTYTNEYMFTDAVCYCLEKGLKSAQDIIEEIEEERVLG